MRSLTDRIDDLLPQTQCTRCGYPDCRAYAEAIARDDAAIDRCPPGGAEGIERLAALTGREASPLALDPACGTEGPRSLAVIDEAWCIGCTLCLDACPTDAILGINKHMHTVMEAHCTGCELCVPVCPVDCIALEVATPGLSGWRAWSATQAEAARRRHDAHRARQARAAAAIAVPLATPIEADAAAARKRAVVAAALARAAATHRPPSADKP